MRPSSRCVYLSTVDWKSMFCCCGLHSFTTTPHSLFTLENRDTEASAGDELLVIGTFYSSSSDTSSRPLLNRVLGRVFCSRLTQDITTIRSQIKNRLSKNLRTELASNTPPSLPIYNQWPGWFLEEIVQLQTHTLPLTPRTRRLCIGFQLEDGKTAVNYKSFSECTLPSFLNVVQNVFCTFGSACCSRVL